MNEPSAAVAVEIDEKRHIAVVTLTRPPHNFLDLPALTAIADSFDALAAETCVRVVVLASEGKNFCAGFDFGGQPDVSQAAPFYEQALRLFASPKPSVCAVQGAAVGAGFGLSMTADFRVATTTTRFSANFARFGFHPGFGLTATLPHAVGRQHALDLFYSGRDLHGAEAVAIGLCAEMVDSPDSLLGRAIDRAAAMATSAPLSLISIRQAFWGQQIETIELAIAEESTAQKRLASTSDFAEGLRAAAERRPPDFGAK